MQITDQAAAEAIKILLKWLGDNPNRPGLQETPKRVLKRYKKIFDGYHTDLQTILKQPTIPCEEKTDIVIIPNIEFISFCEHHLLPMIGKINIAYLPSKKLAGIGTIIKIVNIFTHRLQLQENLTAEIAKIIENYLKPEGVAVNIDAKHYCVDRTEASALKGELITNCLLGKFQTDAKLQNQFLTAINKNNS